MVSALAPGGWIKQEATCPGSLKAWVRFAVGRMTGHRCADGHTVRQHYLRSWQTTRLPTCVALRNIRLVEGFIRGCKVSHEQALDGLITVGAEESAVSISNGNINVLRARCSRPSWY